MTTTVRNKVRQYTITGVIGQGAYGDVFKARNENYDSFAVKVIPLKTDRSFFSLRENQYIKNEIAILKKCVGQKNIVHFVDDYQINNEAIIVTEFCNGGDLSSFLRSKKNNRISENEALIYLKQILNGFKALHKNRIIHRDFKAANVLLHDGVCKIADFGFAIQLTDDKNYAQSQVGTILTMSPQVYSYESYGLQSDIWSIGVVLYQMIYGQFPFQNPHEYIKNNFKINYQIQGVFISQECKDFINCCLTICQGRMNWTQIYQHPLFNRRQMINCFIQQKEQLNKIYFQPQTMHGSSRLKSIIQSQKSRFNQGQSFSEEIEMKLKQDHFQKYQDIYRDRFQDTLFFSECILPFILKFKFLSDFDYAMMIVLMKQVLEQLLKFYGMLTKNKNFTYMPQYFDEFVRRKFYSQLCWQCWARITEIVNEIFTCRKYLKYSNFSQRMQDQIRSSIYINQNFIEFRNSQIDKYWIILASNLKQLKPPKSTQCYITLQCLIRVIRGLEHIKSAQKIHTKQFVEKCFRANPLKEIASIKSQLQKKIQYWK